MSELGLKTSEIDQEKIQIQTPTENNAESPHHDSEYDTADTAAEDDSSDLDALDDDDEDDESDVDGSIVLDLERQDGDGQEEDGEKKKVDDDEDRSNPQYIPKKGTFYEHDDRTADEPQAEQKPGEEPEEKKSPTPSPTPGEKPGMKKWQSAKAMERWSHDRFDVGDQAPKSRAELVSAYGYDIRSEEGPPRARRRRRYGRGPNKYTRKWEDGEAYGKTLQRKLRPEDFPALGSRNSKRNPDDDDETDEDFKENQSDEFNQRSQPEENNRRSQNDDNRRSQNYDDNRRSHNNEENRENIRRSQNHNEEFKERRSYNQNEDSRPANRFNDSKSSNRDRNNRFNSGRSSLEFKNQNRGKQEPRHSNPYRENTDRQFDDAPIMESMSFTNTKMNNGRGSNDARYSNGFDQSENYNKNNNRNSRDRGDRPSNTTNRTQGMSRNQNVPAVNNSKPILNQQQQQQPQQQQIPQQQQQQPLPKNISEVNSTRSNNESSRPKRYSSLRQKSGNDGQQQQQHHVHDPNQEKNILLQLQQSQDKTIYHSGQKASYPPQQLPIHDIIPGNSQNILSQQQHSVVQGVQNPTQYQSNFYGQSATQEYTAQTVQQPTVQSSAQTPQLISVTQYPAAQYTQAQGAYMQPPPTTAYLPQQPTPPQTQILNYVPQITPVTPQAQFQAPYPGYQNYTPVVQTVQPIAQQPQPIQQPIQPLPQIQPLVAPAAPTVAGNPSTLFQPSGITYYAPQTQIPPRPILAHKRPTNAIPILAPPERGGKGRGRLANVQFEDYEDESKPADSADSIDHILDNMFVQRAPYQPPARKSPSPAVEDAIVENSDKEIAGIGEAVQNLVIKDEIQAALPEEKSNENSNQQEVSQETYRPEVIAGGVD